jgi:lipid-A-disaccharide synthase
VAGDGPRRVLVVAGEPSGDAQAARLVAALKRAEPGADIYGVCGPQMRDAGARVFLGIEELSIMGFSEVVSGLGRALGVYRRLVREIRSSDGPDTVVLVDFPDFNIPLARAAKKAGRRVVYYVSPQVWAWRRGRISKIARRVDRVLVLFPFEEEIYREHGVDAHFVGHPLAADVKASSSREALRRAHGLDCDQPLIALLPGSRAKEVRAILPVMLGAAVRLGTKASFAIARAPSVDEALIRELLSAAGPQLPDVAIVPDDTYNLVAASDAAAVASGTATVECALLGCPMVVLYRMSGLSYAIARSLVRVPHIAMPNIILNERVVPELVQDEADPSALARELSRYLEDPQYCEATAARLASIREMLVRPDAADRAARLVLELAS